MDLERDIGLESRIELSLSERLFGLDVEVRMGDVGGAKSMGGGRSDMIVAF